MYRAARIHLNPKTSHSHIPSSSCRCVCNLTRVPAACASFQIQLAGLSSHSAEARRHIRTHRPPDSSTARENRSGLRPQQTQAEVSLDSRSASRHRAPKSLRGQIPRRGSPPGMTKSSKPSKPSNKNQHTRLCSSSVAIITLKTRDRKCANRMRNTCNSGWRPSKRQNLTLDVVAGVRINGVQLRDDVAL